MKTSLKVLWTHLRNDTFIHWVQTSFSKKNIFRKITLLWCTKIKFQCFDFILRISPYRSMWRNRKSLSESCIQIFNMNCCHYASIPLSLSHALYFRRNSILIPKRHSLDKQNGYILCVYACMCLKIFASTYSFPISPGLSHALFSHHQQTQMAHLWPEKKLWLMAESSSSISRAFTRHNPISLLVTC